MTKLIYRAFEFISFLNSKFFLLHFDDFNTFFSLIFYMNDFFEKFKNFENQFRFLRDHFLSRIEWTRLKLSFRKLKLFINQIKTLNVIYVIDEHVYILKNRIIKITR